MESSDNYNDEKTARALVARDTEPSIDELSAARRIRRERESRFNRSWLKDGQVSSYIGSVIEEINVRAKALRHQAFEIGRLLYDVKELLPHGEFHSWVENNLPFSKRVPP